MSETTSGSEACAALAKALTAAQAEMRNPPKDSVNPHFKSKYADLATVRDAVIPVLAKHGLCVVQLPCEVDAGPALRTILMHESGEWIGATMLLRAQKQDPQGIGSALTYCRRYALQSVAGVAADADDDGEAGARQPVRQQEQKSAAPAQQAAKNPPKLGEGNAVADLSKLLGDVADARKVPPLDLWAKLLAMYAWQPGTRYDDLRADQLKRACDDLRATLAAGAKGGAK